MANSAGLSPDQAKTMLRVVNVASALRYLAKQVMMGVSGDFTRKEGWKKSGATLPAKRVSVAT
jgi:hypothetical protein